MRGLKRENLRYKVEADESVRRLRKKNLWYKAETDEPMRRFKEEIWQYRAPSAELVEHLKEVNLRDTVRNDMLIWHLRKESLRHKFRSDESVRRAMPMMIGGQADGEELERREKEEPLRYRAEYHESRRAHLVYSERPLYLALLP